MNSLRSMIGIWMVASSGVIPAEALAVDSPARALVVQAGHSGGLTAIKCIGDCSRVATASSDGSVLMWDVASQRQARTFRVPSGEKVQHITASRDGAYVVIATWESVYIYARESGRLVRRIASSASSIAFYGDASLAIADRSKVLLLNIETGSIERTLHSDNGISRITVSEDGRLLAAATDSGFYRGGKDTPDFLTYVWDTSSGRLLWRRKLHEQNVNQIFFDGDRLLSCDNDTLVSARAKDGKPVKSSKFRSEAHDRLHYCGRAPNSMVFVVDAERWRLLDANSHRTVETLKKEEGASSADLVEVDVRHDRVFLANGSGPDVQIFSLRPWRKVASLSGRVTQVRDVAFGPDGKQLYLLGDGVRRFDFEMLASEPVLNAPVTHYLGGDFRTRGLGKRLSVTADGSRALALFESTYFSSQYIYQKIFTGEQQELFGEISPKNNLVDAALSSGGSTAVLQTSQRLVVWNNGALLEIEHPNENIGPVATSADGRLVAAAYGGDIEILDTRNHKKTRVRILKVTIEALDFDPTGKYLAIGTSHDGGADKTAYLYETSGWRRLRAWGSGWRTVAVAFHPTRAILASAEDEGRIILQDRMTGDVLGSLDGHSAPIYRIAFDASGKRAATASADGTVRIWDISSLKTLAVIVTVGASGEVIFTPDGYFSSTREALEAVGFRIGDNVYTFRQFEGEYHRPDILAAALGFASKEAVQSLAAIYAPRNAPARALLSQPPEVKLVGSVPLSTKHASILLQVAVQSTVKVADVLVYANGVPLPPVPAGPAVSTVTTVKVAVPLQYAKNFLEVGAATEDGTVGFAPGVQVIREAPDKGRRYYVGVGVGAYPEAARRLAYPAKDVTDIALFLNWREVGNRGFSSVITDTAATRATIRHALKLLAKTAVDDEVVIYLSGHGVVDSETGTFYFAPVDMDFSAPGKTGISYEELKELLVQIPARRKLVLLDSCNSGSGLKGGSFFGRPSTVAQTAHSTLLAGSGASVISAATSYQEAIESAQLNNSAFAAALKSGFWNMTADATGDGVVGVSELHYFVSREVRRLTAGRQTPTSREFNPYADFPVFREPANPEWKFRKVLYPDALPEN